jgi:hypothetical protein
MLVARGAAMTVVVNIPEPFEELLRKAFGDKLERAALEGMVLEAYRSGKISRREVQQLLGFDNRWDTEEWLGARGANQQYTLEDLEADRKALDKTLGAIKP